MNDDLKGAYPALEPSTDLENRVARMAAAHDAARDTRRRRRLGLRLSVAGLAVCGLMAGAVVVAPRLAAAGALRRSATALARVQVVHAEGWQDDLQGQRHRSHTWMAGRRLRIDSDAPRRTYLFTGVALWSYDAATRRATFRPAEKGAAFESSGFTVEAMQRDLTAWGWKDRVEFLPDDRTYRRVRISRTEPAGPTRIELWVDPATDLPARMALLLERDGVWTRMGETTLTYDEPQPADRFVPKWPAGTQIVNLDNEARTLAARLSRSVASTSAGGRTVAVRSAQVNDAGEVFVLYTAGKSADDAFHVDEKGVRWYGDNGGLRRDWELTLTDERGVRYARQSVDFETDADIKTHQTTLGARPVLDGEKLEGDWFVPLTPQPPTIAPRRLRLAFRMTAESLHGAALQQHGPEPLAMPVTARLECAPERVAGRVPDWWERLMGDGSREAYPIRPEQKIAFAAARARADHFVWDKSARNLPLALRWLDIAAAALPAAPNRYDLHYRRAECLGMMGRIAEAKVEVERALAAWPREWSHQDFTEAAMIYRSLGDEAAADRMIDRAIAQDPSQRDWLEKGRKRFRRW